MANEAASARRVPVSNLIGLFFGGLWAVAGSLVFSGPIRGVLLSAALLVTVGLAVRLCLGRAGRRSQGGMFRRWPYLIAVALEIVAIRVAVGLLPRYGAERYLLEVVGIIVGLHFIGLWKAAQSTRFLFIAAGMCVVSGLSLLVQPAAPGFKTGDVVAGLGNALILWIGASLSDS